MRRNIVSSRLYDTPVEGWTQGVRVEPGHELVFVSGLTARDAAGNVMDGSIEAQARRVFENMRNILHDAGCDLSDVVQMRWYMLDFEAFNRLNDIRREYLGEPLPASTGVAVSRFLDKRQLIEIEAIAAVPIRTRDDETS